MVGALVVCTVGGFVCKVGVIRICSFGVIDLRGFIRGVDVETSRSIIPSSSVVLSSTA